MSWARSSIASAAESGVTVKQVRTRSTVAGLSPKSKPTLSQDAASRAGANRSRKSTISATIMNYFRDVIQTADGPFSARIARTGGKSIPPARITDHYHDQRHAEEGDEIIERRVAFLGLAARLRLLAGRRAGLCGRLLSGGRRLRF